jgi:hypothetical protein
MLGLGEFQDAGRLAALKKWSAGRLAPMTVTGLVSLFPLFDLLLAAVLLAAIFVLLIKLLGRSKDGQRGSWLTENIPHLHFRRFRFRFWTMLGLIAILGLECGWDAREWKKWQLREQYLDLADGYATSAFQSRFLLQHIHRELTRLDAGRAAVRDDALTPNPVTHERVRFENHLLYRFALITAFDELVRKYAAAAKHPLRPITPDPPLPQSPSDSDPAAKGHARDHGRILAAHDELVRSYPKNALAHEGRAWILATCPNGKYRDGRSAVTSATQACRLTNWREVSALSTLAAAYAEAGDFPSAVQWEQKARELSAGAGLDGKRQAERLALYQAGKPFRLSR